MDIQRLRSLTTGKLHTKLEHVQQDLNFITRDGGILTHMIARAMVAVNPWLREKVTDERFWDGELDVTHTGDYPLEPMTEEECEEALQRFEALPNPIEGACIVLHGNRPA